ncbi:glycosyltransferase family 4 protein [Microvirga lotononidis]|uniref:Glycosyltransferase n=1 Tax=Microvirga lotononidis TaxID=864069 RepID=I4YNL3_9HYPH|nr:glycosyltransferase family 4 protein [Microvirga lotononidis]EIM25555.1 glycosyltransferase [Microvirga lotononidis]WQO26137.1 glycosyltransferase family 4 protein [Microvirga lotononidis]
MTIARPVAFYAPLKSPNHPLPSGDRTMARLLMKALERAGYSPRLASEVRTLDKVGNRHRQESLREESLEEADRLVAHYRRLSEDDRPRLWFTYHVYYKAPDWIGPRVADALGIPYAIAEGSRASKRARGPWALGHDGAQAALDRADVIFSMTAHDREALEAERPSRQALVDLPPFLDLAEWPLSGLRPSRASEPRLLAVAMMREGDKLASYRILAAAMERLQHLPWSLQIVGDGEARDEVARLFSPIQDRVRFHGRIERKADLAALYLMADLVVWPAVNEAYGMVLLEAQSLGCAVVAGTYGGVASVVRDGETGLLTPPGDIAGFADAVSGLVRDRKRLETFGDNASRFVKEERDLGHAALRLTNALQAVTG